MKCEICGSTKTALGKGLKSLGKHISYIHKNLTSKQYYDKYLKKENASICLFCGKETRYRALTVGYDKYCSNSCATKEQMNNETALSPRRKVLSKNQSAVMKKRWAENKDFRKIMSKQFSKRLTKTLNRLWQEPEYKEKMADVRTKYWSSDLNREKRSKITIERIVEKPDSFGFGNYKTGYYFSKKNNCEIYYASSYELQAFEILEKLDVVKYFNRCKFSIDYLNPNDSRVHKYVPDIEVVYESGKRQIIETKPASMLEDEIVVAKASAAQAHCDANDLNYTIWTEKDLN